MFIKNFNIFKIYTFYTNLQKKNHFNEGVIVLIVYSNYKIQFPF